MPGLPGTGLGGIFYILLILWIAAREGWRVANRQGVSLQRWTRIGWLGSLAVMIVLALSAAGWGLRLILEVVLPANGRFSAMASADRAAAIEGVVPGLALVPFILLALLILAMHAARLAIKRKPKDQEPPSGAIPAGVHCVEHRTVAK